MRGMPRKRFAGVLAALVCLLATPAGAAAPNTVAVQKDPGSGMELRGMMRRLSETMAGRPVIAAGNILETENIPWPDEDFRRADSDVAKLQIIAARYSTDERALIPFQVGDAYVIAPETRIAVNTNLAGLSTFDITGRGLLMADVLTRLTPEQVKTLGSEDGLAVAALPPDMQRAVDRAVRPPLKIVVSREVIKTDESGLPQATTDTEEQGMVTQVMDVPTLRLRARLRLSGAAIHSSQAFAYMGNTPDPSPALVPERMYAATYGNRGVDLPLFPKVFNTFKASDLTGAAYRRPLGLSGVWTVEQVMKRAGEVTGLSLSGWEAYRKMEVFLGAESIAAGDVLDGLRLALTASWRKMGTAYYLAWDRTPLAAIDLAARESAAAAIASVKDTRDSMESRSGMWRLLTTLPFRDGDPLALTDDQRDKLFQISTPNRAPAGVSLTFNDLTPEQQDFLRGRANTTVVWSYTPQGESEGSKHTVTEEELKSADVSSTGRVEVSISVPGRGWMRLGASDGLGLNARVRPDADEADAERNRKAYLEGMPKGMRALIESPQPVTPPSSVRGVVVPALGPSRLATLADEMKRHGLNVLFYPALIGGYATFPTAQFPPHPALRGADGLAAATATMKAKDIRVVAYLNTLAWQDEGDSPHWLDKHPDWLDVDVLGRGRLAWFARHPNVPEDFIGTPRDPHNYVRATEPQVRARLTALVTDIAARKDVAAIAFAAWKPVETASYRRVDESAPELGYSRPDRLWIFEKTGVDPADVVERGALVPEEIRPLDVAGPSAEHNAPPEPHLALAAHLLRTAKAARKDWRAYLIFDTASAEDMTSVSGDDLPKPDRAIMRFTENPTPGGDGLIFPVSYKTAGPLLPATDGPDPTIDVFRDVPLIPFYAMLISEEHNTMPRFPMALYDFRATPAIITDALRWIAPPATKPAPRH